MLSTSTAGDHSLSHFKSHINVVISFRITGDIHPEVLYKVIDGEVIATD